MEKFENDSTESYLTQELSIENLAEVSGGSPIGYWIGYAAGKAANAWTDYMNRNADTFMMM